MTAAKTITAFHHWLLDGAPDTKGYLHVIVLHGVKNQSSLSHDIAHYLNEYDSEAHGNWLAPSQQLIEVIAGDASQRKLLGVDEACSKCPPTGPCGQRKVIKGLALHGHVVLDSIHSPAATVDLDGVFHVSLAPGNKDCHMRLNPEKFNHRCLAPIISDVYLEWLHCTYRQPRAS